MNFINNNLDNKSVEPLKSKNVRGLSSAILLLTNQTHKGIRQKYKLFDKINNNHKAYILFHNNSKKEKYLKNMRVFFFDDNILKNLGYTPIGDKLLPGSNHFPLLKFYRENSEYDFYWCIEDDVHYNGDWFEFFQFFQKHSSSDFISSHLTDFKDIPNWYWWNTLSHKKEFISKKHKIRSLNPIYRISNKALNYLDKQLKDGWQGHHEVLIPTLLKREGFSIQDFGGSGQYVAENCTNRFYKQSGKLNNYTMRYRPYIGEEEIIEKLLYHPVKHIGKVQVSVLKNLASYMVNQDFINKELIMKIINNSSSMRSNGLFNGKMGVAILLYNLASENEEIDPSSLVLDVINEINYDLSFDFDNGIVGIGWGLEYLFQNDYIEGDIERILKEFDKYLLAFFYKPDLTIDLRKGLIGIGFYLIKRVDNSRNQTNTKLINKQWLALLVQRIIIELNDEVMYKHLKDFTSNPFDIYSTYPVLICFLFEVCKLDICKEEVLVLLDKLISYIINNKLLYPKSEIKKLQLAAALSQSLNFKLSSNISESFNQNFSREEVLKIIDKLLSNVNKDSIKKSCNTNIVSFSKGTMGVAFLYTQLFSTIKNDSFKVELEFWKKHSLHVFEKNNNMNDNVIEDNIGVSDGLLGFLITDFFININKNL